MSFSGHVTTISKEPGERFSLLRAAITAEAQLRKSASDPRQTLVS